MAHTKRTITGNQNVPGQANTFSYSGSFDVFKASEVQVTLDNIVLTLTTSTIDESASPREYTVDYNGKTVHIGGATLTSSDNIVIQPVTDMGAPTPRATYEPGASVTSTDLNNNQLQLMRKAMEYNEQKLSSLGGTMSGNLHLGQNVDLTFEGDNNNTYETTLTVADPTADRTITFPDTTGTVVTTGDTGTVTSTMIANSTIVSDDLANDSVTTNKILGEAVTSAKIANNAVTSSELAANSVDTSHLKANAVTTTDITDDAVTADKLAHTSVTPGTYSATDLSVDAQGRITAASSGTISNSEIAADAIDGTKIADDSINSEHYVDASIDHQHLANDVIDGDNIQDDVINSEHYVAGSIDHEHLANDIIDGDNIQDDVINSEHIAAGAVDLEHMSANSVDSDQYVDGSIDRVHLEADIIDGTKLADDAVDSEHIAADSLDTEHYAPTSIDSTALASNAVTENKITDSNVTAAKLASSSVTLAKLASDLKQTTISDSDTQLPTSGAVVDYVAAQIAPIGGLEVIADEDNFPTSQPSSGVVISISDAAGIVVQDGSGGTTAGRSTTARTAGNGSDNVTINNFPSSLHGETLATGVGLMVSSTGTSNTYNYHKILAAETDVKQLSDDINDFNARYRVGSSNPTSALDNGDLFFNTGTGKMLVYNGTNTAWEEVQSIGNFFISTLSPAFNGSLQNFTITNAPTNVQQVILSINGVIQKPNAGTSTPSEGFALDGSTIKLASAPASGSDYFAIVMGSTVNIGTPSDGTVTAAKLTSGAVETAKIADGAVLGVKIASGSIDNSKIDGSAAIAGSKLADDSISLAKLEHGTSSNNGKFLRANNGADPTFETVNTDLVADTSPELGGNLASNGNNINIADNDEIVIGSSNDLILRHNPGSGGSGMRHEILGGASAPFQVRCDTQSFLSENGVEDFIKMVKNGSVDIYYDSNKKIETTSTGATVTGTIVADNTLGRNILVNGDMRVAQRATSTTMSDHGNDFPACDRWSYNRHGVTATVAQVEDAPAGRGFKYSLKWTSTSAVGSIAAGNVLKFITKVEGQDIRKLGYGSSNGKTATLSFWAKGSLAGKIGVSFTRDSRITSHNVDMTANTWEYHEVTIPVDTSTGFSAADSASGFQIGICWGAGSNSTSGTVTSWINFHTAYTGGFTAGQQGAYLTTSGSTFQITGVQLEIGSKATPFEHLSFADELARCQRYFCKSYDYDTTPGTATSVGSFMYSLPGSQTYAAVPSVRYPVSMRDNPTVTAYSTQNANTTGVMSADSTDKTTAIHQIGHNGHFPFVNNSSSGISVNVWLRHQFTADAEL